MVLVIGSIEARAECLAEAIALSQAHVRRSRMEPGCVAHAVHQDSENARRLVFVEEWSDHAALQQHFRVPESRAFVKSMAAIATGAPSMTLYEANRI